MLWGIAKAPLRWSAAVLVLLVLSLEISSDASGLWHTPLAILGDLLQHNLDMSARIPGLALSGLDLLALYMLGISFHRRATGSALDAKGFVPAPTVVVAFLVLYVGGVAYAEALGIARGGAWRSGSSATCSRSRSSSSCSRRASGGRRTTRWSGGS